MDSKNILKKSLKSNTAALCRSAAKFTKPPSPRSPSVSIAEFRRPRVPPQLGLVIRSRPIDLPVSPKRLDQFPYLLRRRHLNSLYPK